MAGSEMQSMWGRFGNISLNMIAFEVWKLLMEAGVKITNLESCQIFPDPNIESKIARTVEKGFARKK